MLKKIRKTENLKASILIANYNNGQYLKECIDSIKKQNYRNTEIIIMTMDHLMIH